jgi:hypothetical protein
MQKILFMLVGPLTVAIKLIAAARTDSSFSRDIAQSPTVVGDALETLDVVGQPHTQAKLGEADRDRRPQIVAQRDTQGMTWSVMSGGKAVLKMRAALTPTANGGTHVSTSVERGDGEAGPDVPALFASTSDMAPLFAVAVERALKDYIPSSERSLYSVQERPWGYTERHREPAQDSNSYAAPDPNVRFEPGKPMVNPTVH